MYLDRFRYNPIELVIFEVVKNKLGTINTKPLVFRSRLKSRVKREYLRRTSEYLTLPYDNEPASWSTGVLSTHEFSLSTHARRDFLIEN